MEKFYSHLGISKLNEMQQEVLKVSKDKSNLLVLSPTGSGKTLAFILPLLDKMDFRNQALQSLIIAPSRELAIQIETVFKQMKTGLKVACFYGGHDFNTERNTLIESPQVLIGTPGRLVDHLRKETIDFSSFNHLVCDEFDKSLEYGFELDIKTILNKINDLNTVTLTSATQAIDLPIFVPFEDSVTIDYLHTKQESKFSYELIRANDTDKAESLIHLLCEISNEPTIVFCNHRDAVERIGDLLDETGVVFAKYHGGLKQDEREKSLFKLKSHCVHILLCTDLGSRGLDIEGIENVIHYQLPISEDAYIHRNGRTGRVDKSGKVYFVLSEKEYLPEFVDESNVSERTLKDEYFLPEPPHFEAIFVNAGKKNKVNKIDIVGTFCQKGGLKKDDLGLIEVKDFFTNVAVKRQNARRLVRNLKNVQIKKKKVFVAIAR